MHILALEWVPLYFWLLLRTLSRTERRWPLLAALALAASSLASWYYLLFCVVLTFPYLVHRARADRELRSLAALRRALLLGAAYLALLWPLFAEMIRQRALEPWYGAHDPVTFSADLLSFFVPNAAQALGAGFRGVWGRFSGNPAENCDYLGYALMALALLGAFKVKRARSWIGLALAGVVLALGPRLRVGGVVHPGALLPYGWLTRLLPLLDFTGCPVRAGFIATFSLCAAAAMGLAWLLAPGPRLAVRQGAALALVVTAGVEFWPHAFTVSRFPTPAIFRSWAEDPTTFAVLDLSGDTRPLYNAVLHGHPLVDAYVSRVPVRLQRWLDEQPVIGRLQRPRGGVGPPHPRRDPNIDFDWGEGSPMPELGPDEFVADWHGFLLVPETGDYTLVLGTDDTGALSLDGQTVLTNGGSHPYLERSVRLHLTAGPHALAASYREWFGQAVVRLLWARGELKPTAVPPSALVGPDGRPGLEAIYRQLESGTGLSREASLDSLRRYQIRYLILPEWRHESLLENDLGLRPIYVGEGLRIYEVPGA